MSNAGGFLPRTIVAKALELTASKRPTFTVALDGPETPAATPKDGRQE
jgi:hypothetical protein